MRSGIEKYPVKRNVAGHRPAKWAAAALLLLLAACGRQGGLMPPPEARPADPRVDRYFEDEFDGPIMAPGDTEHDEGFTGVEQHRHRGRSGGDLEDDVHPPEDTNASEGGGGSA